MSTTEVETPTVLERPAVPVYPELLAAAGYIREHGWGQRRPDGEWSGGVCISNAICLATGETLLPGHMALGRVLAVDAGGIFAWNDTPGRTKQEVIDLLERVGWLG